MNWDAAQLDSLAHRQQPTTQPLYCTLTHTYLHCLCQLSNQRIVPPSLCQRCQQPIFGGHLFCQHKQRALQGGWWVSRPAG